MTNKKIETRNIILQIFEGGFFMGAMVFLDQFTIMIGFIQQLSKNPVVVSLIPAALVIGFNAPGLLTAQWIQRIQNRHLLVALTGLFQRLMILLLALFTYSLGKFSAVSAGIISATIYFLFSGIGGIGVPAWLDLFARTVPANKRSRVVAVRNAIGAGTGIVFPVLIAYVLKTFAFPNSYRILFLIAFGFLMVSWIAFLFINDYNVPSVNETKDLRFGEFIKNLYKTDRNFVWFLASRILFGFSIITMSFYTMYYLAQNKTVDDSIVASFALALNASKIIGGLALGYLGDKKGNLLVFKIGIILVIPTNLLVLYSASLPLYFIVFVLFGLSVAVDINTYQSFIGEFGNSKNRIFYTTMGSSIAGIFSGLLPVAAGILLSTGVISFKALFIFCAGISCLGFIFIQLFVKDPRFMNS